MSQATLLNFPIDNARYSIATDASDYAIGAVLTQFHESKWQPLTFLSKKLSPAEQKYSAFDRELLAIYTAVKHFRYFVEGREFTVFTDHKPLIKAIESKTDRSPRQARHLDYISQFTTDIQHVSGKENIVADYLSRPYAAENIDSIVFDLPTVEELQKNDDELKALIKLPSKDSSFKLALTTIPLTTNKV